MIKLDVRPSTPDDVTAIAELVLSAFGASEGPQIVRLIADLSADDTARPTLALVASLAERIVGHVLFSKARLAPPAASVSAALLAPLAVHVDLQSRGIGGRLVLDGLQRLSASGVDLVFVLGHPGYYPRFGFSPAESRGFQAPYPIPPQNAAAWMVRELRPGALAAGRGRVICADALANPAYWRE